jgi:hypothetical protein
MKRLTFLLLMVIFSLSGFSQIRFSKVDPDDGTITIKNFGDAAVDITDYRLCALFQYTNSGLSPLFIVNGALNLEPGSSVELSGFSLMAAGSDLGLYKANGSFGDTAAMVDFLQWGSSGNGRESVADSKGIWSAGDFLNEAGPYFYQGDGTQDGLAAWSNVNSIRDQLIDPSYLTIGPNPFTTSTFFSFNLIESYQKTSLAVTLTDITGRTVRPATALPLDGKMIIERNNLNPGIYVLNLYASDQLIANKKLIITD